MSITKHGSHPSSSTSQRFPSRLLIFARAPIRGQVKTRLQPGLTTRQSEKLHRRLVEHTLNTALGLADVSIEFWVSDDHPWWAELASRYAITVYEQQGADLGERMAYALEQSLQRSSKAVVIGSDCPFISVDYLSEAFGQLDRTAVVVGPAADGGYVLLGLARPQPTLFDGIDWGTERVLNQTLRQVSASGLNVVQLKTLRDIDRPEDVQLLGKLMPELVEGIVFES